jgi:hypothetical protein
LKKPWDETTIYNLIGVFHVDPWTESRVSEVTSRNLKWKAKSSEPQDSTTTEPPERQCNRSRTVR